ncbi:hypothetical protein J6590_023680 [Homalodisca vitripennis]|nr:hypothetical protein J6590_023680 [Homalodisca vitripennis]
MTMISWSLRLQNGLARAVVSWPSFRAARPPSRRQLPECRYPLYLSPPWRDIILSSSRDNYRRTVMQVVGHSGHRPPSQELGQLTVPAGLSGPHVPTPTWHLHLPGSQRVSDSQRSLSPSRNTSDDQFITISLKDRTLRSIFKINILGLKVEKKDYYATTVWLSPIVD